MQLWTKMHAVTLIPAFAVMIVAALVITRFLKDKDEKYKLIPVQIIAILLVVMEIAKQICSLSNGYDPYHVPLHFCSLFIFLLPLFAFYRGKYKEQIRSFTFACTAMLFVFMAVYPELIYGESSIVNYFNDFFSWHSVTFHNLVLFAFVLIIALRLYEFNTKRDILACVVGFAVYSLIAGVMAQILRTNFNNFYECSIGPFREMQLALQGGLGYGFGQTVYVILVALGIQVFAMFCYWLLRGTISAFGKIKEKLTK